MKIYYKARLEADETGLVVVMDEWHCIHETPCYAYCVRAYYAHLLKGKPLKACKRYPGAQLKRIHKTCSRFAFDQPEDALKHLHFMKCKQLKHLERQQQFLKAFLAVDDLPALALESRPNNQILIPGSRDLVHEFYNFDC